MRFILVISLLSLLVGCSRGPTRRPPIDKVDLVASVYPLAAMAEAVGGPVVNVRWLVESGQTLRGLGEAARDQAQLARLVVYNSAVTEPSITSDAAMSLGGERLLRLDQLLEARDATASGWLWLDPVIVRAAAIELQHRLLAQRASQAAILADRTGAFTDEIDGLLKDYGPKFAPLAGRRVLTLGHDFEPMLARWKIADEIIGDPAAELGERDMDYLRSVVHEQKSVVMLIDDQLPAGTRNRITSTGVKLVAIDALGSSTSTGRNNYLALMRFDYDALLEGMK